MSTTYTTLLSNYQPDALATALPTAFSFDYCINAAHGEVGELFNKRAKAQRDGWSPERLREALLPEYGDIAWPVAVLLDWQGVRTISERNVMAVDNMSNDDPWLDVAYWSHELLTELPHVGFSARSATQTAERLWIALADNCAAITGQAFSAALAYNVAKLADRKQRGVLSGSGDFR